MRCRRLALCGQLMAGCHAVRWPNPMRFAGRMCCESVAGCCANRWPDVVRTRGRMLCVYALPPCKMNRVPRIPAVASHRSTRVYILSRNAGLCRTGRSESPPTGRHSPHNQGFANQSSKLRRCLPARRFPHASRRAGESADGLSADEGYSRNT